MFGNLFKSKQQREMDRNIAIQPVETVFLTKNHLPTLAETIIVMKNRTKPLTFQPRSPTLCQN